MSTSSPALGREVRLPDPGRGPTAPADRPRPRGSGRGRARFLLVFLGPALLVYLAYVVYPAVQSVNLSLYDWSGPGRPATFVGLDNYTRLLADPAFYAALLNNVKVIVVSAVFQLPLGLLMALVVTGPLRGRRVWRAVFFLPMLMSTVAIGLLWSFIFNPSFGLLNGVLGAIGLESLQQGWLGQSSTALWAVLLTTVWQFAPFYMIIYSAAIVGLPQDVYEAARLDGAGTVRQFWSITLPLLRPVIVTTLLLSVVGSIKFFDLVYVMTGGGPSGSTELLATYMFRQGFVTFQFGYASAIATAMLVLSLLASLVILSRTTRPERKKVRR